MPEFHLIANNIISVTSAVVAFGLALFTYLNGKRQTANVLFSLVFLGGVVFLISHVVGANIADPHLSKEIFMFNLVIFPLGAMQIHAILAVLGKTRENKFFLWILYASSFLFAAIFLVQSDLFLLPSVPKMYFPNYYNPGPWNWVRMFFFYGVGILYSIYLIILAYFNSKSPDERNKYRYLIVAMIVGYGTVFIPNLLVYNIEIDPLWGMPFTVLFAIPFAYGAVKYEMLNIRIIAKQALIYSVAVGTLGGLIVLFNYTANLIETAYLGFPSWVAPFISSLLVVTLSVFVWQRLRQDDTLKYEFINTVTHKFRTPLTRIKWATENLFQTTLSNDQYEQIGQIQSSDTKLVELTNMLINVSHSDNSDYVYRMERQDVSKIAEDVFDGFQNLDRDKKVTFTKNIKPNLYAMCDAGRIKFVLQVFVENAVHYTPALGTITITALRDGKDMIFSVKDTGIGIPKEETPLMFSKFYRGQEAKLKDTEGLGVGLYISKGIIEKHQGKIWAESEGLGKGATFSFSLPMIKTY